MEFFFNKDKKEEDFVFADIKSYLIFLLRESRRIKQKMKITLAILFVTDFFIAD